MSRVLSRLVFALAVLAACERDASGPDQSAPNGLKFELNGSVRSLHGEPAGNAASLLQQSFVVARADSLNGIVVVGYESTDAAGTGNLLVLQAPRAVGTYSCTDGFTSTPCHGRYIVGVRNGSTAESERYFAAASGSVTLTQIGPDRLRGTFTLTLKAADDKPGATIEISNGTIDVPYIADPNFNGALECLLAKVGVSIGTTCTAG